MPASNWAGKDLAGESKCGKLLGVVGQGKIKMRVDFDTPLDEFRDYS